MTNSSINMQELNMISLESISGGHRCNHLRHSLSPNSPNRGNRSKGNITINLTLNITVINIMNSSIGGPLTITTLQQNVL